MKKQGRRSGRLQSDTSRLRQVMGIHSCQEVLNVRPDSIKKVWLREDWEKSASLANFGRWAEKKKVKMELISLKKLDVIGHGHQGVVFFVDERPMFSWELLEKEKSQTVVLLDGVVDPQNLGAMMRTGWLMGVDAFFLPKDRAVALTPIVNKVACGGVEYVPVDFSNNFVAVIKELKKRGFWVYSLAENESEDIYDLDFSPPEGSEINKIAWVVGNEGKGIRSAVKKESDVRVRIPQKSSKASYNASVALAMALAISVGSQTSSIKNV